MSNDSTTGQRYAVWDTVEAVRTHLRDHGLTADVPPGEARAAIRAAGDLLRVLGVDPVIDGVAHMVLATDEPWTDRDDRAVRDQ